MTEFTGQQVLRALWIEIPIVFAIFMGVWMFFDSIQGYIKYNSLSYYAFGMAGYFVASEIAIKIAAYEPINKWIMRC